MKPGTFRDDEHVIRSALCVERFDRMVLLGLCKIACVSAPVTARSWVKGKKGGQAAGGGCTGLCA
jgi:hypothetical protein